MRYGANNQRAAQAMREVDTYLPCPDSFPLWQSEESREKMVEYAKATWIKSAQLPPELALACAEICLECYFDTVRFSDDTANKKLPQGLAEALEASKKLTDLRDAMLNEKSAQKRMDLHREWMKLLTKASRMRSDVARAYGTFGMNTGDIPLLVLQRSHRIEAVREMGLRPQPLEHCSCFFEHRER